MLESCQTAIRLNSPYFFHPPVVKLRRCFVRAFISAGRFDSILKTLWFLLGRFLFVVFTLRLN